MYNILLNEKYVKPSVMLTWNDMFNLSEQQWSKIYFLPFICVLKTQNYVGFKVEITLETIVFYTK